MTKIIATVVVIVVIGGAVLTFIPSAAPAAETAQTREVVVRTVADLSSDQTPLSLLGTVTSRSEATLLAEAGGRITGVYKSLGDHVEAGAPIVEFENASQRAAVTQARGAYNSAAAAFAKVSKNTQLSLGSSKEGAVNALLSAYASIDDSISKKTDENFSNPSGDSPTFLITSSDSHSIQQAQNQRVLIQSILKKNAALATTLSVDQDLVAELDRTTEDTRTVRSYLDTVVAALNGALPNATYTAATISANKADATLARTAITGTLSALSSAEQTLKSQLASQNNGTSGGSSTGSQDDVAAAEGNLNAAQGTLAAALANLEKTIIRAPFAGTINLIDAKLGDNASLGKPLVTVANNGALEIVASVTETDRASLQAGGAAVVNGSTKATITKIAPALNPQTKKIEVRLALAPGETKLTNGASVRVDIVRATNTSKVISIPITALKITPDGPIVFTVSVDKALEAHTVVYGSLSGDKIVITEGLTGDMSIVVDARGLKEGDVVTVK